MPHTLKIFGSYTRQFGFNMPGTTEKSLLAMMNVSALIIFAHATIAGAVSSKCKVSQIMITERLIVTNTRMILNATKDMNIFIQINISDVIG